MPALLKRMSMRPNLDLASSTAAVAVAGSDTSPRRLWTAAPDSAILLAAASRLCSSQSTSTSPTPSAASCRATSRPRPEAPPVMRATFPARLIQRALGIQCALRAPGAGSRRQYLVEARKEGLRRVEAAVQVLEIFLLPASRDRPPITLLDQLAAQQVGVLVWAPQGVLDQAQLEPGAGGVHEAVLSQRRQHLVLAATLDLQRERAREGRHTAQPLELAGEQLLG